MQDLILAVNAGSSSLKISLYELYDRHGACSSADNALKKLLEASFSNLSSPPAMFSVTSSEIHKSNEALDYVSNHEDAFEHFLSQCENAKVFERSQLKTICHRVVHGGSFTGPVSITEDSFHQIEGLADLAPLHNASALSVMRVCANLLPGSKSIACFDTCFHQTIPEYISTYAIDLKVARQKGLRKYGFHGLSYGFVLRSVSTYLKKHCEQVSIIACHLGSGASICAIKRGKSLDTSMGFTPLDGLPGATRSGSLDPCLVFHYLKDASQTTTEERSGGLHLSRAEETLNKAAGWKALTGTTNFREITSKAQEHSSDVGTNHSLAFQIFVDRILNFIGAYYIKLGGASEIDAIVFTGGIGEHSAELRTAVIENCACLGFKIDERKNQSVDGCDGTVLDIGTDDGGVHVLVCRTDEQLEMVTIACSQ